MRIHSLLVIVQKENVRYKITKDNTSMFRNVVKRIVKHPGRLFAGFIQQKMNRWDRLPDSLP